MLADYGDLLRFLEESGLLDRQHVRTLNKAAAPDAAEQALQSTRELREATARVFYKSLEGKRPQEQDVGLLEKYFMTASRHRELRWEAPEARAPSSVRVPEASASTHAGLTWHWGRHENDPELPVWTLALSVADILLSPDMARVHTCAVDTCRWLFLDTSKNHKRRWCNMKVCGNRMKARRFQARRDQT